MRLDPKAVAHQVNVVADRLRPQEVAVVIAHVPVEDDVAEELEDLEGHEHCQVELHERGLCDNILTPVSG